MIITNKKTGKNITGLTIKYLENKITKEQFELYTKLTPKLK